jgi:hypothetical protein
VIQNNEKQWQNFKIGNKHAIDTRQECKRSSVTIMPGVKKELGEK